MKISDNPAKHEVLIKQYLRSLLDISNDIFIFVKSKLCIGQRKYKQKFTTQGRKE